MLSDCKNCYDPNLTSQAKKACLCKCKADFPLRYDGCVPTNCVSTASPSLPSPTSSPTVNCNIKQKCPKCYVSNLSQSAITKCMCACRREFPQCAPEIACPTHSPTSKSPTTASPSLSWKDQCTVMSRIHCPLCYDSNGKVTNRNCLCKCLITVGVKRCLCDTRTKAPVRKFRATPPPVRNVVTKAPVRCSVNGSGCRNLGN
jgi:hypothetical protein